MPGFIAQIGKSKLSFSKEKRQKLVVETHDDKKFSIQRRTINKFLNDKVFQDTRNYFILTEGVILNKLELIKKYTPEGNFLDCIQEMYEKEGETFFNLFRGSFSGFFYDKKKGNYLVYTDQIGDKQIFLYKFEENYLVASEIGFIVETLKQNGIQPSVDEIGCYMSLTYGFTIEDKTLVKGLHKLPAGHYYKLSSNGLEEIQYHRFTSKPNYDLSRQEIINKIDELFIQAVKREFEKDQEYGYKHIACLSGGLDSRMTVMVAHELGYTKQLNITFSQSNYLDFTIAQQIATDLNHEFLFKTLDGGNCIYDIEKVTPITYGSANFFGLAHGKSLEDLINYDGFGIIHTGQLGDVVIGTYMPRLDASPEINIADGAYSQEIIERLQDYKFKYEYENSEIFRMYNRGFSGIGQGLLTFQENSDSCSPFTDVDFMEFCLSIPLILRFNHKIYFDWILAKHPQAAKYVWENTKKLIQPFENKIPKYMTILGYTVPAFSDPHFKEYFKGFLLRRLGIVKKGQKPKTITLKTPNSMNPVDYWFMTNPDLRRFLDSYWEENEHFISDEKLKKDMKHLYMDCVMYERLQSISVLSSIKLIKQ